MSQARSFTRPALIVLGALLVGWLVTAATMDRIFWRSSPALALFWNPRSADANARAADLMVGTNPQTMRNPELASRATRSLDRQPVNPVAARLLAFAAAGHGDERRAERLLGYAEAMSRRDLPTQLALIESDVGRGNVASALLHYDRALKSTNRSRELLFPVLSAAADEAAVRKPLARMLAQRPQWWRPFLVAYVPKAQSADSLFAFARAMGMDRAPSFDPLMLQDIERRLVDLGAYAPSAALYNVTHGLSAGDRTPLRNGDVEQPGNWDPFDWNMVDEENLSAVRQPSPARGGRSGGNALFLLAANGRGGDLALQLTLMPPGRYLFTATVGGVVGDPLAFPQLVVRCARDGREIVHQPFPPAPETGRAWRLDIVVPASCTAQRVVLRGASALDQQAASPWIDDMALRPAGGR